MRAWLKKHKEQLSYIFWCIMTTAVSWTAFGLFSYLFGLSGTLIPETVTLIANILSWVCAVSFSFVANKIRVFESKSWHPRVLLPQLLTFFTSRAAVGAVEILAVPLFVAIGLDRPIFGIDGFFSKIIVTPLIILLNYLCAKFLVFRKK